MPLSLHRCCLVRKGLVVTGRSLGVAGFGWAQWAAKKTGRTGWVLLTTAVVTLVPLVFEVIYLSNIGRYSQQSVRFIESLLRTHTRVPVILYGTLFVIVICTCVCCIALCARSRFNPNQDSACAGNEARPLAFRHAQNAKMLRPQPLVFLVVKRRPVPAPLRAVRFV